MEPPKPKRGDIKTDGMIYWDTVDRRRERWITPEKFREWSDKKAGRMREYNQAEERQIASRLCRKIYSIKNPGAQREADKKHRIKNGDALDQRRREWAARNPEKVRAAASRSRSTLEKRRAIYKKTISDPIAKMRIMIRGRSTKAIKRRGWDKDSKTAKYLGCDWECARVHLENQFRPGMTWENHGFYGWHIDHIVPLASAKTLDDLIPLLHYTNLQPLWAEENLRKWASSPEKLALKKYEKHSTRR